LLRTVAVHDNGTNLNRAPRAFHYTIDKSTRTADHNLAVVIEGHTPYSAGGSAKRPERLYGASLWSRFAEFGLHLGRDGALHHWRGPREERDGQPSSNAAERGPSAPRPTLAP